MAIARSQSISLALHVLTLALLLVLSSSSLLSPPPPNTPKPAHTVLLAPPLVRITEQAGGGSNTSPEPARRGIAPPRSSRTFIPPLTHADPKLAIVQTIDLDVPTLNVAASSIGDPFSKYADGLFGDKGGHLIGNVPDGPGIGDHPGGKLGISGRIGEPIQAARVIHQVDPEFSEEARKAKYQGMVVLLIEIGTDGRPHNPKVIEPAGLGLDQKAIEAVEQWRFRPAQRAGRAILTTARVEVHFHLL
jgi:TonB family protein